MSNVYFTSDWHLGHPFAAKARGYADVSDHDLEIMESMLSLTKNDTLWVLGDICWNTDAFQWLGMLPHVASLKAILGNHDTYPTDTYRKYFSWVGGAARVKSMWLTHIPVHPQEASYVQANIHGHIHNWGATPLLGKPYINVNWDYWKRPVSLVEIREIIAGWEDD